MGNYVEYFNKKIEDIGELVLLPNEVRMYAINALRGMNKAAVERRGSQHPIDSAIKTLQNIKDDSINNKYKIVYNQHIILLIVCGTPLYSIERAINLRGA